MMYINKCVPVWHLLGCGDKGAGGSHLGGLLLFASIRDKVFYTVANNETEATCVGFVHVCNSDYNIDASQ